MRIAILFRGPVRPDYETAISNINLLSGCFNHLHEIDVYVSTWQSPEAHKLIKSFHFKDQQLYPEPSQGYIINELSSVGVVDHRWINTFKQCWMMKKAIPLIGDHDFIVQSRFDAKMKIAAHELSNWLDHECYTTIHVKGPQPFTNDQIGVATPRVMMQAWDYHDLHTLGRFMNNVGSGPAEQVLEQIIEMNSVKTKQSPIEIWELDSRRHQR